MENLVRLNKFIASNGISSRRKVDEMIVQGRVTVNGDTITELGYKINSDNDKVALDGEVIRTSTKKIYIILNKPEGIITSVSDEKHRTTVIDLINLKEKIFPVGRLDYNTTGLLLLTNDGELANKLMHPKSEIYKTYFVKLSKPLEEKHRIKLTEGIKIEGKITAPSKIRYTKNNNYEELYISIYEGRNRQVRNMFEHYGYFVRELERVEYAGIKLDGLKTGEWRMLTGEEVKRLYEIIKDTPDKDLKSVPRRKYSEKKVFKKYESKFDKNKSEVRKPFKRFQKRDATDRVRSENKKETKWGFKKRLSDEKEVKLGFRKFDDSKKEIDGKREFKKFDKRETGKREFKEFGKRDDGKREFKKFDKRDDGKREFKKFDKRDDVKRGFKKFDKRDDGKKEFRKFDKRDDGKRGFKKIEKRDDGKDVKKEFKKFDKRDDRKVVKGNFKKFDMRGEKPRYKKFEDKPDKSRVNDRKD